MFSIIHEGNNISDYVISFDRIIQICTGIGTLDFTVSKNIPYTFGTWDTVILYESGTKKGTFNISTFDFNANNGTYSVSCQDNSKRLIDYFITDYYEIDYLTYARPWIEQFLAEAGVNYTFTVSDQGGMLSDNTSLGLTSAYDAIIHLLQLSGWYIYFDEDGDAIVGDLETTLSPTETFTGDEILNLKEVLDDKMLRNKAVVWGNSGIFTKLETHTQWNYDTTDKRAVVLANSGVRDLATAGELAQTLLDEFDSITDVVTAEIAGYYDVNIGDIVRINTSYYNNTGLVTTLSSSGSDKGFITTVTINERCPRLFGFFSLAGDYVYVGTDGNGVWRKSFSGTSWESFSDGLPPGSSVTDLYISNNNFGLVTASGQFFYRTLTTTWSGFTPSGFYDELYNFYPASSVSARRLTINHLTDIISVGYNYSGSPYRSWVLQVTPAGVHVRTDLVTLSGLYGLTSSGVYNYNIIDIDTNDTNNILTLKQDLEKIPITNLGYRWNRQPIEQLNSTTILPKSDSTDVILNTDYVQTLASAAAGGAICKPLVQAPTSDRIYAYFVTYSSSTGIKNFRRTKFTLTWTGTQWSISSASTTVSVSYPDSTIAGETFVFKTEDNDDVIHVTNIDRTSTTECTIRWYEVNFSSSTYTTGQATLTRSTLAGTAVDNCMQKNQYIHGVYPFLTGVSGHAKYWKWDMVNHTLSEDNWVTGSILNAVDLLRPDDWAFDFLDHLFDFTGRKNNIMWWPTDDGDNFLFMYPYRGAGSTEVGGISPTEEVGIVYGDKNNISKLVVWQNYAGLNPGAAFYMPASSVTFFAGDTKYYGHDNFKTNLVMALGWYVTNGPYPDGLSPYTNTNWIAKIHLDNSLNPTYVSEDLWTSDTTERNNFFRSNFGIYLSSRADCTRRGIYPFSSKNSDLALFLQQWDDNQDQVWSASSTVAVKLPEFEDIVTIKKPGSQYTLPVGIYGNPNEEDFGDLLYLIADDGGLNPVVHTYDLGGNLINRYPSIDETVSFIACGFSANLTSSTSIIFRYPKTGHYYYQLNYGNTVAKQDEELFDRILYTPFENYHLEISKESPTEVFSIATSGYSIARPIYQTFSNTAGSFDAIIQNNLIYDGRVFDQITPSGDRFFGVAVGSGVQYFPVSLSGGYTSLTSISGVHRFETTNYLGNQYMFIGVSGVGVSGVLMSGRFYQKDSTSSFFFDRTYDLPPEEITVIRVDDLI